MRLFEIMQQNTSQASAVKNVTDILTTQLPILYRRLGQMAEQFEYNNGPIGDEAHKNPQKFKFIIGSQKSQWYNSVFFEQLKPSLYKLLQTLPKQLGQELGQFLNSDGKFSSIEESLIPILLKIGKTSGLTALANGATAAMDAKNSFDKKVHELWNDTTAQYDDDVPAAPKDNIVGQQNAAVNNIVNDVLSRLNRNVAGEIRNAIARSENKLQALQQELARRGIRM